MVELPDKGPWKAGRDLKPMTTRAGLPVRIYATDGWGQYPIHGAFKRTDGGWSSYEWTKEGRRVTGKENDMDLVNV